MSKAWQSTVKIIKIGYFKCCDSFLMWYKTIENITWCLILVYRKLLFTLVRVRSSQTMYMCNFEIKRNPPYADKYNIQFISFRYILQKYSLEKYTLEKNTWEKYTLGVYTLRKNWYSWGQPETVECEDKPVDESARRSQKVWRTDHNGYPDMGRC